MIIVGLTGSIGMGKSSTAAMLRRLGVPVHDADAQVHRLLGRGGAAVKPVAAAFPQTLAEDHIDRKRLGDAVFADRYALRRLESILHPLVREAARSFLMKAARNRARIVILDIPLLFESGRDADVDAVIVVTAPPTVQRQRVMARPGMTGDKFRAILSRQVPDIQKRRRADYVILTGGHFGQTFQQVRAILRRIAQAQTKGRHWPPRGQGQRS
jgi:dephospho-CoA kinase